MRLRVRTILWGMVPLAIVFAMAKYVLFTYLKFFGPQISMLSVGERVVVYGDPGQPIRAATADAEVSLVAGTEGVVTRESAWDEDSTYPGREIGVMVDGGPHSGRNVTIDRDHLRKRRSWP
jgi:hypothetical protein